MQLNKTIEKESYAVKITAEENGKVSGRAYLYVIFNPMHPEPFGLFDVFVEEEYRGKGVGTRLVKSVIEEAKERGCYKLIGTSRYTRPEVHKWYEKLGFKNYGIEFRMDL